MCQSYALFGKHLAQLRQRCFDGLTGLAVLCAEPDLRSVVGNLDLDIECAQAFRMQPA